MYQKITLAGSLGKPPEMRYSQNGDAVTSMNIACGRKYNNKAGDLVEETSWFRVSAWGKHAEACNKYLTKGSKVLVVGRLAFDKETGGPRLYDKKDGTKGSSFEVTAEEVIFSTKGNVDDKQEVDVSDNIPF